MKKKLSLLFLVLGLVLFFSCTDDDSQVEKVQGSKVSSFIVSPDSAIAISNQAIRAISEIAKLEAHKVNDKLIV